MYFRSVKKAESEFKKQYPSVYSYLSTFKSELINRNAVETGIRYEWYALKRFGSRYHEEFAKKRLFGLE
jgi:hypothetical protein